MPARTTWRAASPALALFAAWASGCVADPQPLATGAQSDGGSAIGMADAPRVNEDAAPRGIGAVDDGGTDPFVSVTIPTLIAAPDGKRLTLLVHARGAQLYACEAGGWTLKTEDATLYNHDDDPLGALFDGPTWMSTADESAILGSKVGEDGAPIDGAIPWQSFEIAAHMGTGVFDDVTFVQRVNTGGGKPPSAPCDASAQGTDLAVAYTADYYFYADDAPSTAASPSWPFAIPMFPQGLGTPPEVKYKFELHGWGDQRYRCAALGASDGGAAADAGAAAYGWVLEDPSAALYDEKDAKQGRLGGGPTWTSDDGSSIVAAEIIESATRPPTPIPWLLLRVTSHGGPAGVFSDVTVVQQANPARGVPPSGGCDAAHADATISAPFTADYYFHTGGAAPDGGS